MNDTYPSGHNIDTPPIHEKAQLYHKTEELFESDLTEFVHFDNDDEGEPVNGLYLEKETDPDGDLRRNGFQVIYVKRVRGHVKRGRTVPEMTTVKGLRQIFEEFTGFELTVEDGYPEIRPYKTPRGIVVPDSLESPKPITKLEGLELRGILEGLKKEVLPAGDDQ
mgnify:CR=1 FL=1